jgi:hypothetical protein
MLEKRPAHLILQSGIGLQYLSSTFKFFTISMERPTSANWHLGLMGNFYFPAQASSQFSFDTPKMFLGGYEVGGYAKYYLHGRFSGHKSGLYFGPDLRFGVRRYSRNINFIFPPPPASEAPKFNGKTTKILMRLGYHKQLDNAVLEIFVPMGLERYRPDNTVFDTGHSRFVMIPTLQMGLAF